MARLLPSIPDPRTALVDVSLRIIREWLSLITELRVRVPLSGTVTFAAATTKAVTFAAPEQSTDYFVSIEAPEDRRVWITSKTVTGFTINVSASSSATYGWALLRR